MPIVTSYLSPATGVLTVTGVSLPVNISVQTDFATEFHRVLEWNTLRGECAINLNNPTLSNRPDGAVSGTVRLWLESGEIENVYDGSGPDTIVGNGANNLLAGGVGCDDIFGMGGYADLFGETGNDTLHGGVGADEL